MNNIVITPESSRQFAVIKDFLKEMKINFRTEAPPKNSRKMSEDDFYAKIDLSVEEIKKGDSIKVRGKKQLNSFLEAL